MSVTDADAEPALALRTSSYATWRPEHGAPVVISLTTPKWLPEAATWPKLWPATPRWAYFRASPAEFDRAFLAQLQRYGVQAIAKRLTEIARSCSATALCLLCWEPPEVAETECHRRQFARYWLAETGELITEIEEAR